MFLALHVEIQLLPDEVDQDLHQAVLVDGLVEALRLGHHLQRSRPEGKQDRDRKSPAECMYSLDLKSRPRFANNE